MTSTAVYFGTGTGTVSVNVTGVAAAPTGNAAANLQYFFGAFGPILDPVPLLITGTLNATANVPDKPNARAIAIADESINHTTNFEVCEASGNVVVPCPPGSSPQLTYTKRILVQPNVVQEVDLGAACVEDVSACAASADPTISFAPGFDPPPGLTLEFSPGPPEPTATPEPGSALLLASGLVALLKCRRKRF